jgi:hypothetical protein
MNTPRSESPTAATATADPPRDDVATLTPADDQRGGTQAVLPYTNEQQGTLANNLHPQAPLNDLSRLEKLLVELRYMIYTHLMGEISVTVDNTTDHLEIPEFATMRALCLTCWQISSEVKGFVFRFTDFSFHDAHTPCWRQLRAFATYIGPRNVTRVRKFTISLSITGATANHHCMDGFFMLKRTAQLLRMFPALTDVDIDLEIVEGMPSNHAAVCTLAKVPAKVQRWISVSPDHPMQECFRAFLRSGCIGRVDVAECWAEFLASEHLSDGSMALYEAAKKEYRALLLVTFQDWLGTPSLRIVNSLE